MSSQYSADKQAACGSGRRLGPTLAAVVSVLGVLGVLAGPAWAFVVPGPFALRRAVRALRGFHGQEIVLEVEHAGEVYPEVLSLGSDGAVEHVLERERLGVPTLLRILKGELGPLCAELGIDVRQTALTRQRARATIAVGVTRATPDRPQLWIDQRSFLPTGLSVGGRELRLLGRDSLRARGRFYERIEVWERGRLVWRARLLRVRPLP